MDNLNETFKSLKDILFEYSNELVVKINEADNFYLNTHYIMKNKSPMYFGSIKINKRYVSF